MITKTKDSELAAKLAAIEAAPDPYAAMEFGMIKIYAKIEMEIASINDELWRLVERMHTKEGTELPDDWESDYYENARQQFIRCKTDGESAEIDAISCAVFGICVCFDALERSDYATAISNMNFASSMLGYCKGASSYENPAVAMAKRRHAENYAMADDVEKYWRANIPIEMPAQRAADEIIRANLVPMSHKKIAEIISRLRRRELERKR